MLFLIFLIRPLLEARAEKCKKFRWFFGVWEDKSICFWYLLTFKGKCFDLDNNQFRILKEIKDDHQNAKKIGDLKIRNLYVSGPFGCGKTVILVEVCWMRIYFCLRMILEQGELEFSAFSSYSWYTYLRDHTTEKSL